MIAVPPPTPCARRVRRAAGAARRGLRALAAPAAGRLLVAAAALLASAAALPASAAAIAVVDDRGRRIELPAPARRIVSLLPSNTEAVCALDACDRLVGVDRYSGWPERVAALPRLGGLEDTPIERIVALRPDLVLAPASSRAIDRLESLGVRVLALEPRGLDDTHRVLRAIAATLGRPDAGDALWARTLAQIDAAGARLPAWLRGAAVYVEVSEAPHAASAGSFVGETLARMGLRSVVPASLGPFPQLNPEFVVRAAPTVIVATERGLAAMAARPGWGTLAALREQRGCGLPPAQWDTWVRPGPRLGEAAQALADCLVGLPPQRP
jgi:iron complex transport system substrate-binding protein